MKPSVKGNFVFLISHIRFEKRFNNLEKAFACDEALELMHLHFK